MKRFHTAREAKEFLVSKIVEEAQRENVVLSETERKMLFFSETGWTLPDMSAVSDEFDRLFDQSEYEKKMAGLIRVAAKRARKAPSEEYDLWWDAIRVLSKEDHYLLVIIRRARLRPRGDLLRLWATGAAIVGVLLVFIFFTIWISTRHKIDFEKYVPARGAIGFYIWMSAIVAVILYEILRLTFGARKVDNCILKGLEKVFPKLRTGG